MGISPDTERLARMMFMPEQIPDVLEILAWYDGVPPDNVHRAVLALSKGNVEALLDYVAAAVTDFRDVLLWASEPEPTPEERAATRERVRVLVQESEQRRREYLEGRFGVEGARQIERSNKNLFGEGRGKSVGTDRTPGRERTLGNSRLTVNPSRAPSAARDAVVASHDLPRLTVDLDRQVVISAAMARLRPEGG
jgi:hypothetical protein